MISIIIISVLLLTNLFTFLCLVHLEQETTDLQTQLEGEREFSRELIKTGEKS